VSVNSIGQAASPISTVVSITGRSSRCPPEFLTQRSSITTASTLWLPDAERCLG
jgi:hypothetical protein